MTSEEKKDQERPLVTFALFVYNHEQFIREAVEGAFSQTYRPLEIILSDDCSSDRTFKIIKEMTAAYEGPHKIILNRNETNLGIGAHINRCMELSHGELIIAAAGDDVSLPERTKVIVDYYLSNSKIPCSIYSAMNKIDQSGNFLKYYSAASPTSFFRPVLFARRRFYGVPGCAHAWHRCLFDRFGPLSPDITYEDATIPFRASLLGAVIQIPQPLVRYRSSGNSVMGQGKNAMERRILHERRLLAVFDNNLRDLMYYCTFINPVFPSKEDCLKEIVRQRNTSKCIITIIKGPLKYSFWGLITLFFSDSFKVFLPILKIFLRGCVCRAFGSEFVHRVMRKKCER